MRTAEAVSLLFILFCRDPQFRLALYKLDEDAGNGRLA